MTEQFAPRMPTALPTPGQAARKPRGWRRRLALGAMAIAILVVASLGIALVALHAVLRASLPQPGSSVAAPGMPGPALTVDFDARGVPTIAAASESQAAYALGVLHAQNRLFQMDLMRRAAAGRLAELVGPAAVPRDTSARRHRFAAVSSEVVRDLPEQKRDLLAAYAAGVNAGAASLGARPPEFLALGATFAPWTSQDTVLVLLEMFNSLSEGAMLESQRAAATAGMPVELAAFLYPRSARTDHPVIGPPGLLEGAVGIPGPETLNLRAPPAAAKSLLDPAHSFAPPPVGSNNWAVAGSRSANGKAMLANDMHLSLSVPNIWYRACLSYPLADSAQPDRQIRVVGVTLPGAPGIVAGSSQSIAWGFTNLTGDNQDFVLIERDADRADHYLTPDGSEKFGELNESIVVRGAPTVELKMRTTRWGVMRTLPDSREAALRWTAHDADKINLGILDMANARSLDEGVVIARSWLGPPQNVLMADSTGRIGWVLSGYLPKRVGLDGSVPVSWAKPGIGWDGALDESARPMLIDPPDGVLFSANARTVPAPQAWQLGTHFASGERQSRIAELLAAKPKLTLEDVRLIAADVNVVRSHQPAADLLLSALKANPQLAPSSEMISLVARWKGDADTTDLGFVLIDDFRRELAHEVLMPIFAAFDPAEPGKRSRLSMYRCFLADEPIEQLLKARPMHLLSAKYASFDEMIASVAERVLKQRLSSNQTIGGAIDGIASPDHMQDVRHPFSQMLGARMSLSNRAIRLFIGELDMPLAPLRGSQEAVRVATRGFGASERFVISPGPELTGVFSMPGGQSGHFLSPNYADGHADYVADRAVPVLPQSRAWQMLLTPAPPTGP